MLSARPTPNDMAQRNPDCARHHTAILSVRWLVKLIRFHGHFLLGKKTMENEILHEALEVAQQKKWISHAPSLPPIHDEE